MRVVRSLAKFSAILLLPVLVATGAGPGSTLFRCRMSGEVSHTCCCASDEEPQRDAPARIDAAGCCEALSVRSAPPPVDVSARADTMSPPVVFALPSARIEHETSRDRTVPAHDAQATEGPPIVLKTRSLLL